MLGSPKTDQPAQIITQARKIYFENHKIKLIRLFALAPCTLTLKTVSCYEIVSRQQKKLVKYKNVDVNI